ncbi:MAG: hypothetical protein ACI8W8_000037 [Rhodothermales bacterium]|jgi:uncharacterized protein YcfL
MKITLSALILLLLLQTGCSTVQEEGPHAGVRNPQVQIAMNNAVLTDDSLAGKIAVEQTSWSRTENGMPQVWALIRNRTDYRLQVEARTRFYDAQQAPLPGPAAWQRISLGPNTTETYRVNGSRADVGFYSIEIREGR